MRIARNTVAKLLSTEPSNIQSLKQNQDNIYIKLANSETELSMTIQEYQKCRKQLRSNKNHLNRGNFITITIIISMLVLIILSSINAKVSNNEKPHGTTESTFNQNQ